VGAEYNSAVVMVAIRLIGVSAQLGMFLRKDAMARGFFKM